MKNTFQILAGFLERFGDEVEGRQFEEPSEETTIKLRQLATGALPEPDRAEVFALLNSHTEWISRLAKEVKTLRPETASNGVAAHS
jgi:hypothetical protein